VRSTHYSSRSKSAVRTRCNKILQKSIAQTIHRMTELLEKSGQLWTQLLEDGSLQDLQGREDKVHAVMEDLKQ
jgi:hypothetical protein